MRGARYTKILTELLMSVPAILQVLQHPPISQFQLAISNRLEAIHGEITTAPRTEQLQGVMVSLRGILLDGGPQPLPIRLEKRRLSFMNFSAPRPSDRDLI